jgi:DNA polymerase-3 subunit delta'
MSPARTQNAAEPDRIVGFKHPRETYELIGQDVALSAVSRAVRTGMLPPAWLITGPQGTGKATLAYRIARYLLRYGANQEGAPDLSVAPNDVVSRQIEAGTHPGLLVLRRQVNEKTGRLKSVLEVDEIRKLGGFFGMTSGARGWRVAIVDSADEMNDNAANALLKILEEPPSRGLLMLVSHAPGRLLPTIRSRCRRLSLKPLDAHDLSMALARLLPETSKEDRAILASLSEGSLGLALRLSGEEGLTLAREADALLQQGDPGAPALIALADRIGRNEETALQFSQFLIRAVSRRIRERAAQGKGDRHAVEAYERLAGLAARAQGLHMDPRQTIIASAMTIRAARQWNTK